MLIATLPYIKLAFVIANSEDGHKHGDGYFRPGVRSAADKSPQGYQYESSFTYGFDIFARMILYQPSTASKNVADMVYR